MAAPYKRVVITGMGALTPLGLSATESFSNALAGQSGIAKITQFDASTFPVQFAGEVKNFNLDDYIPKKEQKKMDRFIHLGLAATAQAIKDCGIEWTEELKDRTGVFLGVGMGGLPLIEETHETLRTRGPGRISPFFIPQVIANMAAGHISINYGFRGPNFSITSACATGCHAIGEAARYIQLGIMDVMVAGGAESTVSPLGIGGFAAMKALSTRNDDPTKASRPWDQNRDGFVLAEAAGTLILEEYEHAKKRGAKIYGELTGYGVSSDANHMTNPSPGGAGAQRAMQMALSTASLNPSDIGYVNAHGTSTPAGDLAETEAIKGVFKDEAKKVWVSSTKSMTGHALGAAGAIESVFSLMALHTGKIPPTINLENPSPECDLDYVPLTAREKTLKAVMNNSFGFGGTNACLIFSRV
jgi:3-oxoacyl-[acyl-carrier-protein] synthase II